MSRLRLSELHAEIKRQRQADNIEREMRRIPSRYQLPGDSGFWARITAYSLVDDNRWKYSFSEVIWTMTAGKLGYGTPEAPRIGPVEGTGYAWNSTEMDNTDVQSGSGWEDQDIDFTFDTLTIEAVNPIGVAQDGDELFPVVWMRKVTVDDPDEVAYVFEGWNTPMMSTGGYF